MVFYLNWGKGRGVEDKEENEFDFEYLLCEKIVMLFLNKCCRIVVVWILK